MNRIRVLVVDDSVVIRSLLRQILAGEPDMEAVGVAANGRIALAMLDQVSPEVVTLDIEMPEMNGLQTLAALRKVRPRLPVIMFSTLTERGAVATLEAFSLGASDYVTKPSNVRGLAGGAEAIRSQLLWKIRALCRREKLEPPPIAVRPRTASLHLSSGNKVVAVVIGTSTGGPNALSKVLPLLPDDFPVPVMVVQHMPPTFTRFLAERLNKECRIRVHEAKDGSIVQPGGAWIAPGDFHLTLERNGMAVRLRTNQAPPENSCRPSVDVLFRSAAQAYGSGLLGVVMTGMGQDGLRGSEVIRDAGGCVIAQDEASSVVWGMPGFVVNAGLAESVLPVGDIGLEIIRRTSSAALGRGV